MPQPETFAPVTDLGDGDALEQWRFLVGADAQVRLLTAMGDFVVLKPSGLPRAQRVFLLDPSAGTFLQVAESWEAFKARVALPDHEVAAWLKYDLLCDLVESGKTLQLGECYSPTIPPFLGGKWAPSNFEPTRWHIHVYVMSQIYQQAKDLPPGTPITGFDVKWE